MSVYKYGMVGEGFVRFCRQTTINSFNNEKTLFIFIFKEYDSKI